jgi:hypothetical protein
VFNAVDYNARCRERMFLARAAEQYSCEKPYLPLSFKIICPKCGKRQMVRRANAIAALIYKPINSDQFSKA